MTTTQPVVTSERLRVTANGSSWEYDEGSAQLGRLGFRWSAGWTVLDLGITGGLFLGDCRVEQLPLFVGRPVRVSVGGTDGHVVELEVLEPPQEERQEEPPEEPQELPKKLIRIGRSVSSDVVLDDPDASYAHATLEVGDAAVLRDLNSHSGTWVNGSRVTMVELTTGDKVTIGSHVLGWDGSRLQLDRNESAAALVVEGLSVDAESGRRLLDRVSFGLPPGSLTAVIGPSGSGKSTLLRALTGQTPTATGRVLWEGNDLYADYEQLRYRIGLVPQDDILHPQLTVRQGLEYAARLRLPQGTTRAERAARVAAVIAQVGLEQQAGQRIGSQLSGGQRKRVSIATELLTAPPLLFLDEPTSGLDPGLDRAVMHQLRELADDSRVVVVVTHSILGLDVCDRVVVLARGGKVAYVGPPDGVLDHFACDDYPQLFDLLESPDVWQRIPPSSARPSRPRSRAGRVVPQAPSRSLWHQLATLVRRNLAVTLSDRVLLAMLLVMPLALAGLSRVVQGDAGLSLLETQTRRGPFLGDEASQRLTILIVGATLMGVAMTVRELVKERSIFRREYAVGLSPGLYFASKVLVLGTLCFAQGVLVTWLALLGLPGPDLDGVRGWGWLEIALPVGMLAFSMAVVGLAVSAMVRTTEQTMPALVGVVMVQVVLSSALVPLGGRPLLDQLSWLAPSRWAYAATAASVHLERAGQGVAGAEPDPLYAFTRGQWTTDILILAGLCAVVLWLGLRAVRRSAQH